jgi:nitrogen fixation-related uncharacterized protein
MIVRWRIIIIMVAISLAIIAADYFFWYVSGVMHG